MGKCMNVGCERQAALAVKMIIPDADGGETAAEGPLGIELCEEHGREAEAWGFGGMEGVLAKLVAVLAAPGARPLIADAYVEMVPVGAAEHRDFMATLTRVN